MNPRGIFTSNTLPVIAYVLAGFGIILGEALKLAVGYDVFLAESGGTTISQWFLKASTTKQILVGSIAVLFGFVWGSLIGHLVYGAASSNHVWLLMVGLVIVGLIFGGVFGHAFFSQG